MYNNPFIYNPGVMSKGLFGSLKNIGLGTILSNTQKTLGIINQAIPIVYQVKPIINNIGTIFKIAGAMNKPEEVNEIEPKKNIEDGKPIFYI